MLSLPKILFALSVLAYVASLTQKAFYVGDDPAGWSSLAALASGAFGVLGGYVAWLANPFLWISWIVSWMQRPGSTTIAAALACVCAISFLLHKDILVSEAGNRAKIVAYGFGYWLWLTSCLFMLLSATTPYMLKKA